LSRVRGIGTSFEPASDRALPGHHHGRQRINDKMLTRSGGGATYSR